MDRMTQAERNDWMYGKGRDHERLSMAVCSGAYKCDSCDGPSVAIGHRGVDTPVVVRCHECFTASLVEDRRNRPTREQMIARVDAAIASAKA